MRGVRRALSLVVPLLVVPCFATVAQGQRGRGEEERARQHFETGAILYAQEDYEGALAEFEASHELRAVPVVQFNIAQTLRRLHRYSEAIEAYERYLHEATDLDRERRAAVRATIAELRRAVAPVTVETDVPGVEIRVDGRTAGVTPLAEPLELAAGRRRIVAQRDGYVTVREELTVVGGEPATLSLRMPPEDTAGRLTVRASVPDALVRIDGLDVGIAPVERRLGQGGHQVEVEAPGHETYRHEVVLGPRQERELFADLETERAFYERWWFWTGVGAVVLGGVIVAIVASGGGQADPVPGTLGTVKALRW